MSNNPCAAAVWSSDDHGVHSVLSAGANRVVTMLKIGLWVISQDSWLSRGSVSASAFTYVGRCVVAQSVTPVSEP